MSSTLSLSQRRTEQLKVALHKMESTTQAAYRCADQLAGRAGQLDSLTSPASDASSMLSRANVNLAATLILMRDAREKFDTVTDCEPAIEKLHKAVLSLEDRVHRSGKAAATTVLSSSLMRSSSSWTEQDVYAAGDSMEILRDAYRYFVQRTSWRAAPNTLASLERLYKMGQDSMSLLISLHLRAAGQGAKPSRHAHHHHHHHHHHNKQNQKGGSGKDGNNANAPAPPAPVSPATETAQQSRHRLNTALLNRDLLKSIGEYDEYQPLEARPIREIRSMVECLGSFGNGLAASSSRTREPPGLAALFNLQPQQVTRTEKVGSGSYNALTKPETLSSGLGFPQLDAYAKARREIAYSSMDAYYRRLKRERKERADKLEADTISGGTVKKKRFPVGTGGTTTGAATDMVIGSTLSVEADSAARDAVRCLEHAMVVIAGEKSIYRTIITPSMKKNAEDVELEEGDDEEEEQHHSPFYRKACVGAYSYIVGSVVDRALDVIETVFLKEGGIGQTSGSAAASKEGASAAGTSTATTPVITVPEAYAAAAAGLRMLDGVRMLGPSLAKLCEMSVTGSSLAAAAGNPNVTTGVGGVDPSTSISAVLCIAIHRTTVKNCARTLENLAKAIQDDPMKGPLNRPKNASVSSVSRDVVQAIRAISPFVSAYKSVSKRRALPWDPNMGEDAGEMDSFVRYLVMRLLNSLKGKALDYTRDGRDDSQAKAHIFMINNSYYLLEELGNQSEETPPAAAATAVDDPDFYKISGTWFNDKVNKTMESEKKKYLENWEALNAHLTAVDQAELEFLKNDAKALSYDSGKLIKQRFSGFNESFDRIYQLHKNLCIIDPRLRLQLQQDVTGVFVPRYRRFYEKYTKVKFSKKRQSEYAKYSPDAIEEMMGELYVDPEEM